MVSMGLCKGKVQEKYVVIPCSKATNSLLTHFIQFPNSNQAVVNLVNSATQWALWVIIKPEPLHLHSYFFTVNPQENCTMFSHFYIFPRLHFYIFPSPHFPFYIFPSSVNLILYTISQVHKFPLAFIFLFQFSDKLPESKSFLKLLKVLSPPSVPAIVAFYTFLKFTSNEILCFLKQ